MSREPLNYFTPPPGKDARAAQLRIARRARRILGFTALGAFIFACINSRDGNALQWPAMFIFMACLGFYLIFVLISMATRMEIAARRRREREGSDGH